MNVEPQNEHRWLQRLVGEWTYEAQCATGPNHPPSTNTGTEIVRPIGDLWTVGESTGDMPGGGTAVTVMALGFDPDKGRFVGTFIASMMAFLWLYDGALDPDGKVLRLLAVGPDFSGGTGMLDYEDATEFHGDNERTLTSSLLNKDGTKTTIMTATYRRVTA